MLITFLSDFGVTDDFVGTCRGVIKRIASELSSGQAASNSARTLWLSVVVWATAPSRVFAVASSLRRSPHLVVRMQRELPLCMTGQNSCVSGSIFGRSRM